MHESLFVRVTNDKAYEVFPVLNDPTHEASKGAWTFRFLNIFMKGWVTFGEDGNMNLGTIATIGVLATLILLVLPKFAYTLLILLISK